MRKKKHNGYQYSRDQRREKFRSPKKAARGGRRMAALAVIGVLAAAAIYAIFRGEAGSSEPQAIGSPGQDIAIPVSQISEGKAKFYKYTLPNNQQVRFFTIKSSDGLLRAAFDACDTCYSFRLGYFQSGDALVCNRCSKRFPSSKINVAQGGCNPSPLDRTIVGDNLVIKASDLQRGAYFF